MYTYRQIVLDDDGEFSYVISEQSLSWLLKSSVN